MRVHYGATDSNGNLSGIRWNIWHPASGYFSNGTGGFVPQSGSSGEVVKDFDLELDGDWYFWTDAQDELGAYASTGDWYNGFKIRVKTTMPDGFADWRDVDFDGIPDKLSFPGNTGFDIRVDNYYEYCYPVYYSNINAWWQWTSFTWPDNNDQGYLDLLVPDYFYWDYECDGYGDPVVIFDTDAGYNYVLFEDLLSLPGVFFPEEEFWWPIWSSVFGDGEQEYNVGTRYIGDIVESAFILAKVSKPIEIIEVTNSSGAVLGQVTVDPATGEVNGSLTIPIGSTSITIRVKDSIGNVISGDAPIEWEVGGLPVHIGGSVSISNPGSYSVDIGFGDTDISVSVHVAKVEFLVPELDSNGIETGNLVSSNILRVGKMETALTSTGNIIIDNDPDRFYVSVTPPPAMSPSSITIDLDTISNDPLYSDGPTRLDLTESGGTFKSNSQLLVADAFDLLYSGNGIGGVNEPNHRTHIVKLGSEVRVRNIKVDGASLNGESVATVPVIKRAHVTIFILKHPNGDEVIPKATVAEFWKIAEERFAQVGLALVVDSIDVVDTPTGVILDQDPESSNYGLLARSQADPPILAAEGIALLDELGSPGDTSDIRVFYVNAIQVHPAPLTYVAGMAISEEFYTDASQQPYLNNIIISESSADPFSGYLAAHEVAHILARVSHEDSQGVPYPERHLMHQPPVAPITAGQEYRGSRRLWEENEEQIHAHPLALEPE